MLDYRYCNALQCRVNDVARDTQQAYNRLVVGRSYRDVVMPVISQGDQL